MQAAVRVQGGRVFKTLGDGVCAVFAEADAALSAALEAQRRVRSEPCAFGPLAIRVSLHAGPAEERDGDFFGPTLNPAGPARSRDFEAGRAMDPAAAVAYALGREPGPGGGVQP